VPGDDALPGLENLGRSRELLGVHRPGGFAGAVLVPAGQLRALPDDADPRAAALAEPLANGVHAARLGRSGVEGGPVEHAVVLGAGAIGVLALQAVRLDGLAWVAAVELHEGRRALAARLGASAAFASADEARAGVAQATGGAGADVVIDAVGADATRRLALELLRPGGCAVLLGLAADETSLGFHGVVRSGLTLRGSYAYTPQDYDRALELALDGRAGLGELEPVLPLEAGPDAFAELAQGPSERLKVFLAP
jgi:threonine dehydrogenase-like Zn-dependent dehydrogenase